MCCDILSKGIKQKEKSLFKCCHTISVIERQSEGYLKTVKECVRSSLLCLSDTGLGVLFILSCLTVKWDYKIGVRMLAELLSMFLWLRFELLPCFCWFWRSSGFLVVICVLLLLFWIVFWFFYCWRVAWSSSSSCL